MDKQHLFVIDTNCVDIFDNISYWKFRVDYWSREQSRIKHTNAIIVYYVE